MTTARERQEFLEERTKEYLGSAMLMTESIKIYAEAIRQECLKGKREGFISMKYIDEKIQKTKNRLADIEHDLNLARKAMNGDLN